MLCWSCQREAGSGAFCVACGALQPANDAADAFSVLGLPARYSIDLGAAEAAYKEQSRQVHPDRFATADPRARRASLARTVQLNQAWLTIKDPLRRAGYLLERAGMFIGGDDKKSTVSGGDDKRTAEVSAPPAFLLEIIELHEELRAARRAGDSVKVAFMAEEIRGRAAQSMAGIAEALDSGERPKLEKAARSFMAMRYYQRFMEEALADAGAAMAPDVLFQIGEPGETRVKHACRTNAVGIDLGTTNSLVAIVDAGKPVCLPADDAGDAEGAIVPSVVHYAEGGDVIVGADARDRLAPDHPRDTIASVKRFMGRGMRDAEATRRLTPYRFAPAATAAEEGVVRFAVAGGRAVTPMEVSAEILKVLKRRAEEALGGALAGAVITVPAYFDDGQRQATRDAGRLAGIEVLRLLNEPTAAALAYGLDKQAEGTFAVFDLGGGTFDISILKLEDGVFEVKATGGDSALGGDDFDRVIAEALIANIGRSGDVEPHFVRRMLDAARALKEKLTADNEASLEVTLADGEAPARLALTRVEMEALVAPVLARCAGPVRRAIADAGIAAGTLSGVILVGGATRMPLVRRFVAEAFGREPLADIDPDQVVAMGAAVQADMLAGGASRDDVLLLDVVPLSLGLETMGGVAEKLIHRNTTVPCGARQTFTTFADKQTGFDLHVVQGERELVAECRSLARFTLTGIPPMPAGMARLEVEFTVDADGILRVSAHEEVTGRQTAIEVKPSYGLTDAEVERMILDSFANAEQDVETRLLVEQRVEADSIVAAARGAMHDSPELLTDADRDAITRAVADVELARGGGDRHAIRAAIEELDHASKEFATRRMNRALEQGFRGRSVDKVDAELGAGKAGGEVAVPKVRFEPDGIEIDVPLGTSILEASQKAHAQVGSACGGVCACSTCHVYVKAGLEDLSDASDREEDILDKAFDVKSHSRLGCQSKITRDTTIVIETSRESRQAFLDEHPEIRAALKAAKLADRPDPARDGR